MVLSDYIIFFCQLEGSFVRRSIPMAGLSSMLTIFGVLKFTVGGIDSFS